MNDQSKNNQRNHHQRSIRLKAYDYSQDGLYFITICCQDRECRFGKILPTIAPTMELNEYGQIAYNEWTKLPERFPNFELDVFQIMRNHIHAIISLNTAVGTGLTPALDVDVDVECNETKNRIGHPDMIFGQPHGMGQPQGIAPTATVGDVVGAYKSLVANGCLEIWKLNWAGVNPVPTMGKIWQRNYYEHIIRNDRSYQTIFDYIINNPTKWKDDQFYNQ